MGTATHAMTWVLQPICHGWQWVQSNAKVQSLWSRFNNYLGVNKRDLVLKFY